MATHGLAAKRNESGKEDKCPHFFKADCWGRGRKVKQRKAVSNGTKRERKSSQLQSCQKGPVVGGAI